MSEVPLCGSIEDCLGLEEVLLTRIEKRSDRPPYHNAAEQPKMWGRVVGGEGGSVVGREWVEGGWFRDGQTGPHSTMLPNDRRCEGGLGGGGGGGWLERIN